MILFEPYRVTLFGHRYIDHFREVEEKLVRVLDELSLQHPYMDFYKAKVIVEHRRRRGKLTSLAQLSLYEEFTEQDLERLAPYLSFD